MDLPTLIGELARSGLLGILLALAIWEIHKKDKALSETNKERVSDYKSLATVIEATNSTSRALEATSENRSRVMESLGEATRASAEAIKSQAVIVDQVRNTVERNNDKINLLREEFNKLREELMTERASQRSNRR